MAEDHTQTLLELLIQVNREVAAALDLRTVLQRLLLAATQNVGGERGSIVVLDDDGKPIDATIIYGKSWREHSTQQLRETVDRGLAGWVIQHRMAALVPDTSQDERWIRRPDDAEDQSGAKSAICVPLVAREHSARALRNIRTLVGDRVARDPAVDLERADIGGPHRAGRRGGLAPQAEAKRHRGYSMTSTEAGL
jgi:GAF domain-containing protein